MRKLILTWALGLVFATNVSAATVLVIPGGWYGEMRVDGQYAALVRDSHIATSFGSVPLPLGENVLFLRVTPTGPFVMAGQSHGGRGTWLWNGAWSIAGSSFSVSPNIFDYAGTLYIATGSHQGWRFVDRATGRLWTGDETYADVSRRIGEWSTCGEVTVGQSGWTAAALYRGQRYTLERGSIVNIRLTCVGTALAISYHRQDDLVWIGRTLDASELTTFPLEVNTDVPPPPPPPPPPPQVFDYDLRPLNTYAQRRWRELLTPDERGARRASTVQARLDLREKQADAFFRILWEFRQQGHPEIELYQKGFAGTNYKGFAEDILVIAGSATLKWWSDVGVSFGSPVASLSFTASSFQVTTEPEKCVAPPAPTGAPPPPPPPPPDDLELKKLQARVAELEVEIGRLTVTLTEKTTRVGELEAERDDLKRQLVEARAEIERLKNVHCEVRLPGWAKALGIRGSCVIVQ